MSQEVYFSRRLISSFAAQAPLALAIFMMSKEVRSFNLISLPAFSEASSSASSLAVTTFWHCYSLTISEDSAIAELHVIVKIIIIKNDNILLPAKKQSSTLV